MPKMVCYQCNVELVIEKSGVDVIEMFSSPPVPYKLWQADAWKCPSCGVVIVAGFANEPLAEHYEDNFQDIFNEMTKSKNAGDGWLVCSFERQGDRDRYAVEV